MNLESGVLTLLLPRPLLLKEDNNLTFNLWPLTTMSDGSDEYEQSLGGSELSSTDIPKNPELHQTRQHVLGSHWFLLLAKSVVHIRRGKFPDKMDREIKWKQKGCAKSGEAFPFLGSHARATCGLRIQEAVLNRRINATSKTRVHRKD